MGKLVTFRLKYHQVRLKSAIYTPSQDDEHSRHFYTGVPKSFTKPLIFLPIFRSFTRYFFHLVKTSVNVGTWYWFQSVLQIVKISWNDFNLYFILVFFFIASCSKKNHFFIKNKLWQKLRNQENRMNE